MAKKLKKRKPIGAPESSLTQRERLKQESERMDALDVESAKKALNDFFASYEWTRYGCKVLIQGKFVGNQAKTELLVVKDK